MIDLNQLALIRKINQGYQSRSNNKLRSRMIRYTRREKRSSSKLHRSVKRNLTKITSLRLIEIRQSTQSARSYSNIFRLLRRISKNQLKLRCCFMNKTLKGKNGESKQQVVTVAQCLYFYTCLRIYLTKKRLAMMET